MIFKHLLAKSCQDPDNPPVQATLTGHTLAVLESFRELFGAKEQPTRLAGKWLDFFNLPESCFKEFYVNTLVACLLHDLGKGSSGFQEMIRRKGKQQVRHEHLSAIFILCPEIRQWLAAHENIDERIILSAVLCHHLKAAPRNRDFACYLSGIDQPRFSVDVPLLFLTLQKIITSTGDFFVPLQPLTLPAKWNFDGNTNAGQALKEQAEKILTRFYRTIKKDIPRHRLLMAVRAGLVIADSAGSGLVREGKDIPSWLQGAFNDNELLSGAKIETDILKPRQQEIEILRRKPFVWQDFQEAAGELPARALLISGCGSGKTLAAWRWIKTRLTKNPAARAIFLYPTKATASEGFRDYVSWAPEGILLHSSSQFDLQGMFENPDERPGSGNFLVEERLFALAYWNRRIFSATVHQFLGFMQYSYRSVCLLPLLADSVVVIDEVHSFDKALFSALKQFLANFNVPVLCMTATLPRQRQKELAELGMTIFPDDRSAFADLQKKTTAPRYKVCFLGENREDVELLVTDALDNGKKILWVVNTVDRCQELAEKLNALCYHSRFKLEDRKKRHKEVVNAFQTESGPLLAVTTQVCEMSLDLDADVLVSEIAPITSMIQRMGRCNRQLKNQQPGDVYLYSPEEQLPYSDEDLTGVEAFVDAVNEKVLCQQDLETLLGKYGDNMREAERYTAFLSDRVWAKSRDLADIKETSVQAILDTDIAQYFELRKAKEPIDGLLVPVPKYPEGLAWQNEKIGRFPFIAHESHYNEQYGFAKRQWGMII